MWERFRNRADTEHEQALIRFLLGLPMVAYLVAVVGWNNLLAGENLPLFLAIILFLLGATAIFAWLWFRPQICPPRRYAGMILDLGCTSVVLYLKGELAAPVFIVYLWVTFGNAFRYGKRYLLAATLLSFVGFGIASEYGEFKGVADHLRYGLMIGLLILPLYVNSFLNRLNVALDRAKAGERAKTRFLANVSHEIRTPLTAMLGLSEQLLDAPLSETERRYASMIHDSSRNLLEILNAVLDFSKLQNHEVTLVEEDFLLHEAMRAMVEVHSAGLGEKGPKLSLDIAAQTPQAIRCDRVRLLEVLGNLLRNAIKFTPGGQVSLAVGPTPGKPAGWLRFEVSDTGIGIHRDAIAKLFEPFSQADDSTSRRFGGTGLGLAISRELTVAMGGEIALESEEGKGTRIWVDLPLKAVDAQPLLSARQSSGQKVENVPVWRKPPHILVAEDNEYNRELLMAVMQGYGCRVVFAEDGEKALAAVHASERDPFDLIFMDCHMPNMDGYETASAIRAIPLGKEIPILALTANVEPDNRARCLAAGMTGFLAKPYHRRELLEVLQGYFGGKAADPGAAKEPSPAAQASPPPRPEVSRVVHEVNNHLNVIIGNADALSLTRDDAESRRTIDRILQSAERILALMQKL